MGCSLAVAFGVPTRGLHYLVWPLQVAIGAPPEPLFKSFPTKESIKENNMKVHKKHVT